MSELESYFTDVRHSLSCPVMLSSMATAMTETMAVPLDSEALLMSTVLVEHDRHIQGSTNMPVFFTTEVLLVASRYFTT